MGKIRKNTEIEIFKTKWHNSEIHNDAAKLEAINWQSHDTSTDYAMATTLDRKKTIFFETQKHYERWLLKQDDIFQYTTTILQQAKQIV